MPYIVYRILYAVYRLWQVSLLLFLAQLVCVLWRLTTVLIVDFYELLMLSRRHSANRLGTHSHTEGQREKGERHAQISS